MFTKFVFNRRNRFNKKGLANIEIQLFITRTARFYRSTGINVLPSQWDAKNMRIKDTHPEANYLNKKLLKIKYEADNELLSINPEDYKTKQITKRQEQLFFEFFAKVIKNSTDLSEGTLKIYRRTLNYLKEFHPTDCSFSKIDLAFVESFDIFLKETKNLSKNSRASLLRKFKKVMGDGVKNKLLPYADNPFLHFKVKEEATERKSLSLKELKRIENLNMELRPELKRIRDMFLFACYTGMRYGDLSQITADNFEWVENNRLRLSYTPNKTKKSNGRRIEWIISDFWAGKPHTLIVPYLKETIPDLKHFFKISNAKYNEQLKELGRFAQIKQPLTSHLARHTCITLLVNDYGLDITKAQMIAGHSKIEMTRKYLRTTEKDLAAAAKKINWE